MNLEEEIQYIDDNSKINEWLKEGVTIILKYQREINHYKLKSFDVKDIINLVLNDGLEPYIKSYKKNMIIENTTNADMAANIKVLLNLKDKIGIWHLENLYESVFKADTEDQLKAYRQHIMELDKFNQFNIMMFPEEKLKKVLGVISELTENIKLNTIPVIDLSNIKATDKIIYLYKLGVLDFLKKQQPFISSNNSLASVLSAITGEKSETLQSYLNPIYSDNTSQKNNPLTKENNVSKVENQLIKLGFKVN